MRHWSLKTKVAAASATLTVVALATAAVVVTAAVKIRQTANLDATVAGEARELFRDLSGFSGAPAQSGHPIPERFVPPALRERFVILSDRVGREVYRSAPLGAAALPDTAPGTVVAAEVGGEPCRIVEFSDPRYSVRIGAKTAEIDEFQNDLGRGLALGLAAAGAVVFVGAFWLAGRAVRPVADLTRAAENISAGSPDSRLPVPPSGDEIARLSRVLNGAFERLQNAYASATRFSADASHQLKTPVAVLRAGLEELRGGFVESDETSAEAVEALLGQTRRLTALIEDLLLLAQVDAGRLRVVAEPFDLAELVRSAADDLETLAAGGADLQSRIPASLVLSGDRRRVSLVLQNLVENAAKYTPPGGSVRIDVTGDRRSASVSIRNSGPAIPEAERAQIFERFRRGAGVGETVRGQGLGLNIARELARAHGGDLVLNRSDGRWTEFLLTIAALDPAPD